MSKKKWLHLLLWVAAFFVLALGWPVIAGILSVPNSIIIIVSLPIGCLFGIKAGLATFDILHK